MSPSQRKQICLGGPEKRKLRPCIDSLSIPMHIVKLKKDGLFMSSIRHSLGLPISDQPSACICHNEECPKDIMSNVTTAFKPKIETFPCGTTTDFRDSNSLNKKILKTRYAQYDFPENTDQNCDCDDDKQRTLRFAPSTPRETSYLNDCFGNPIVPEEPCPEECLPCDESPLNQTFSRPSNTQHQSFPEKHWCRRNYPGYQHFRTSSLEEEPCPECPSCDDSSYPNFRSSSAQHETFPDKYRPRRNAPENEHFRTSSAQHEPDPDECSSCNGSPGNQDFWTPPLNDAQLECCLDKTPSREGPNKNKKCRSLGVQHGSSSDKQPNQINDSTSCENWPKYLAELLEEKLRSDSTLLNDSRSNEQSSPSNYHDTTQTSPSCSQNYMNRNRKDVATDKKTELNDHSTCTTPGSRTTERSTEPRVNFKQTNDNKDFQQHFSNDDTVQNSNLVDGSASPVTVILPIPSNQRPEFKNKENQSRVRSPCQSISEPNSQSKLDEIRGKKLNQSFGQPLTKSGDDALNDKIRDTLSCPCHYPPAFNDIACSGRITGMCNCGKN